MSTTRRRPATGNLDWDRDGHDWPNRDASRFVRAAGLTWHVQQMGSGPTLLLVHGTGASTHSWRGLAPALAKTFTVVAIDLPGHGFTSRPPTDRMSLDGMAQDLAGLLEVLEIRPDLVAGHSAGAAILCRMVLDGRIAPAGIVSLNGALLAFRGFAGQIFSPLAKLLAINTTAARLVAGFSSRRSVERIIDETGSTLDQAGLDLYARLVASPRHVGSTLTMMANWNLDEFERDLRKLQVPLLLLVGSHDRAVPPSAADKVRRIVPGATVETQRRAGHLAHEEQPEATAALIADFAHRLKGPVAAQA